MYHLNNFCNIIPSLRRAKGWSQTDLAERLNVSPQSVSKWECGVGYPDVTMFPVLAGVLDVPIGILFGEEREKDHMEDGIMQETNIPQVYKKKFPMKDEAKDEIRFLLGNTCRVEVYFEPPEFGGIEVEASGDPVFMRYFEIESFVYGELTVRIKNPSGSEEHWEPYDRKGYEGENLVKMRIAKTDEDPHFYIVNYLDLAAYTGDNDEHCLVRCVPMR